MAPLPENTQYGGTPTPATFGNLSSTFKNLQQTANTSAGTSFSTAFSKQFNPDLAKNILTNRAEETAPADDTYRGFPTETPIEPQTPGVKMEPAPDYLQYTPPTANNYWVNPTPTTQLRNWPEALGGGQYLIDPSQPGKWLKNERVLVNDKINPKLRKSILGKLDVPGMFEVDHTVPLWAGGADTAANLQIYDKAAHAKKTAIQAVPLTLLSLPDGDPRKITQEQARLMVLSWKDKSADGIPTPNTDGIIDAKTADKIAKKWAKGPTMWDFFGEAFKENMTGFMKDVPVVGEFGKGLVGGFTAGIVPGTEATEESGTLGTASNFAGNLVGMGIGLGKFKLGLKALRSIPGAIKAGFQGKNVLTALKGSKDVANLVKDLTTVTPGVLGRVVPGLAKKAIVPAAIEAITQAPIKRITKITEEALKPLGIQFETGSFKKATSQAAWEWISRTAAEAGYFGAWGQMGMLGRETLTKEDNDLQDHIRTAAADLFYGGLLGGAGQTVRGYGAIGAGTLIVSRLEGMDAKGSLTNAALMMGLHSFGLANRRPMSRSVELGRSEITKMSRTALNDYTGMVPLAEVGKPETIRFDVKRAEAERRRLMKESPADKDFYKEIGPIKTEGDAINFITEVAQRNLMDRAALSKEIFSPDVINQERERILTAGRQLYKETLPPKQREIEDLNDLKSTAERLNSSLGEESLRQVVGSIEILNKISKEELTHIIDGTGPISTNKAAYKTTKFEQTLPLRGHTTEKGPEERKNLLDVFSDRNKKPGVPRDFSNTVLLVKDDITASTLRSIRNRKLALGEDVSQIGIPENAVRAFAIKKTPEGPQFLSIGYVPRKESYDPANEWNVNKDYLIVEKERAADIAAGKTPKENPFTKFDENYNTDNIANAMNADKAKWVTANLDKVLVGKESKEPFVTIKLNGNQTARDIELQRTPKVVKLKTPEIPLVYEKIKEMVNQPQVYTDPIKNPQVYPDIPVGKSTPLAQPPIQRPTSVPTAQKTPAVRPVQEIQIDKIAAPRVTQDLPVVPTVPGASEIPDVKTTPKRSDPGQFIITARGKEGINETAVELIADPKKRGEFTRVKLTELAKEVSGQGETRQGVVEGWPKFLETFTNKIKEASGNETYKMTNGDDLGKLQRLYTTLARSGTRKEIVLDKKGIRTEKGGVQNVGKIDLITKDFNKKEGLPEDSMEIVHVSKNNVYSEKGSAENFDILIEKTKGRVVPVGITGKGLSETILVKMEPKMVERFDQNPEKYLNQGEKLTTPEDKFIRTYLVDVLGMPKNMKYGDFIKRANLIYHRYDQYHGPETPAKLRILKAQTIGDTPEFRVTKEKFESPDSHETESALRSLHEGKREDGIIYAGEKAFDALIKGYNYNPVEHRGSLKALIDTTINGEKAYHKGQFQKVDPAIRSHIKEAYGVNIGPNDIISFDTNAKIGPKTGEFDISLSDIYAKSRSTVDSVSRETPSSERKYISTDEGVKADKLVETEARLADFNQLNQEIKAAKNKAELEEVFNKYTERFPKLKDQSQLFQGVKGEAFKLGAAKNTLSFEIGKIQKNLFAEEISGPIYKNSTMVTIVAPIKAEYDGWSTPKRYVNNEEIILGREQMKEIGVTEGESVVVHRDPSYDINNVVVLKVVDGTKTGNKSLGKENGIVSSYNERIRLQGDQDADTMHVTKIGKGGIPQSEVNAILKRGKLATPFSEVKPSETSYVTASSLKEKIKDQLRGDDQTSWISSQARIMDEVADNKITVKVYAGSNFKKGSKYEILANGKVVDMGYTNFSAMAFEATPKWGPTERQIISQAQREAVDSKKSKKISETTKNDPNWAIKKLWKVEGKEEVSSETAGALSGALKNIQKPYNIKRIMENSDSLNDVFLGKISNYTTGARNTEAGLMKTVEYYKKLKATGVELTPLQEKMVVMSKANAFSLSQKEINAADKMGAIAVVKQIKPQSGNTVLAELIKIHNQVKRLYKIDRARGNEEIEKLNSWFDKGVENGRYTKEDLDAMAYWAATSKDANLGHWDLNGEPRYIRRYLGIINSSPNVAKAYYEGAEGLAPTTKPKAETVKKGPQGGPTPGTGQWGILRKTVKKADGQGGLLGDMWGGIKNTLGNMGSTVYKAAETIAPPPLPTYDVRGIKVNDKDLAEAADILYGEVSNRTPDKQQFEVRHIINTAINRAANNPKGFGSTLTEVLQKPMQYQAYAPKGVTIGNKTQESQYQKIKKGLTNEIDKKKYDLIVKTLQELKNGKFADTTGDAMFYVHASDGTIWLGQTSAEAKQNASNHEKALKLQKTQWGTSQGAPVQVAING